MSVRRLADEATQPKDFAFSAENRKWAEKKIAEYPAGRQQSAVIPLLMRAQDQDGWISRAAIERVADMLGMAYIRVLEVATFYTQFQLQPVGTKAHIQVCGTTPCMLRGAEDIRAVCERRIHAEPHHTNADGSLSWEEVECLGACVNAPMVAIGHDTYEDLTVERFEEILDAFAAGRGKSITPGPQIKRQFSAAEGGATTLTEKPTAKRTRVEFPPPPPGAAPGAPAAAPAPAATATAKQASKSAASEQAAAAPKRAKKEPAKLFEAPSGKSDDLKLISGVGPVLEKALNAIGITTWAQVAKLTKAQIEAVEGELNFPGRVARDNWLQQAKVLARGGVEEYRKVFGKDPR